MQFKLNITTALKRSKLAKVTLSLSVTGMSFVPIKSLLVTQSEELAEDTG